MIICHSNQGIIPLSDLTVIGHSIFLAGPTPRDNSIVSWRPEALSILERLNYDGVVFVPEPFGQDYLYQVNWEKCGLTAASVIVFWVPRVKWVMAGLTTNVEFGRYIGSKRVLYGRPDAAESCKYLDWMYSDVTKKTHYNDLGELLEKAVVFNRKIRVTDKPSGLMIG